jgi:Raf kinase inhibitor-like YbhB/YbcL family protein
LVQTSAGVQRRSVELNLRRIIFLMNICHSLALSLAVLAVTTCSAQQSGQSQAAPLAAPFVMTLPGFSDGNKIPDEYTCLAAPSVVSPEIRWSNVPAGTQSFVLVFHDLEPRPGKGIMDNSHWVLWNIPGNSTGLAEGVPAGSTLTNGTHQMKRPRTNADSPYSYYGPCAPAGPNHHYVFEIYALDTMLNLPEDVLRADILKAADGHILAASAWFGYFHR